MVALATTAALIIAPLVVILTHGPAAHAAAASMAAEAAAAIAAHGHTHGEAGDDHQGGSLAGHSPADHDHPLNALVCQATGAPKPLPDKAQCVFRDALRSLTPDGPRHPPRTV